MPSCQWGLRFYKTKIAGDAVFFISTPTEIRMPSPQWELRFYETKIARDAVFFCKCPHGDSNIIPSTGAPVLRNKNRRGGRLFIGAPRRFEYHPFNGNCGFTKQKSPGMQSFFVSAPRRFECHPLNGGYGFTKQKSPGMQSFFVSAPTEIRTPVLALKGLRPGPLDDGGWLLAVGR